MSEAQFAFDVTAETFEKYVIENSFKVPVLVDFWAAWCGPCQTLKPMLENMAAESGGAFLLAKVNSDEQQELAAQYGVRSLPTVKLFRNGQPVDEFMGAQPESAVREFLERHIPRPSDTMAGEALELEQSGDVDAAKATLEKALADDPDNHRVRIVLAQFLARQNDPQGAEEVLSKLPADKQLDPEVEALKSELRFASAGSQEIDPEAMQKRLDENPKDSEAAYSLATYMVGQQRFEEAIELLLGIVQTDRGYRDDIARKTLLDLFNMLGDNPAIKRYRNRLFMLMH